MYPLLNEAILCLQEHISSLNDIDMAAIAGMGMTYHGERKGPLAIADEIGLDVLLEALESSRPNGERFRPASARLLRTKVRAGHLGAKVGRGFHEYFNGSWNLDTGSRRECGSQYPSHREESHKWLSIPMFALRSRIALPS